tara:strand:- start:218 stop:367 length:150 start_codon:yes stop_codon:yes gene_type:complete
MKETIVVYVLFLFTALFTSNCGIFPEGETYKTDSRVNDNSTSYTAHING